MRAGRSPSSTSRNSSRSTCRPSTTRQSVSGVAMIRPTGPQSQVQKIAEMHDREGRQAGALAVDEGLDHMPHERLGDRGTAPGSCSAMDQPGSTAAASSDRRDGRRRRSRYRARSASGLRRRPTGAGSARRSARGRGRPRRRRRRSGRAGSGNSGSAGAPHRPWRPWCGAGRSNRTGGSCGRADPRAA